MSHYYNDSPIDFKLIQAAESAQVSRRNIGVFAMWLNGLGIPQKFHEFVLGVFVSGNWDEVEDKEEITIKRMARNLSPLDDIAFGKVFGRLRQNSPRFFEWQEKQDFIIIPREIVRHANWHKAQASYGFPYYEVLMKLFNLPSRTSQKALRAAVQAAVAGVARLDKPTRRPRVRKPESLAGSIANNINQLIELVGSPSAAASYVIGSANEEINLHDFAKALLQIKELTPN